MLKRLVLDVEKPHNPGIIELSDDLSKLPSVDGSNIILYEMDQKVQNVKVILGGPDINYDLVKKKIEEYHGVIRSVDAVIAGDERYV